MTMQFSIKRQSGAALFVALIILLLVTLIGVSALRGGMFNEIMAFNAQSDELAFQASESAINGVINESQRNLKLVDNIIKQSAGTTLKHCITHATVKDGMCSDTDTLDSRSSIKSDAASQYEFKSAAVGHDPAAVMQFQFSTVGTGHFKQAGMPFKHYNYQAWRKLGPSSGNFSTEFDKLDLGN